MHFRGDVKDFPEIFATGCITRHNSIKQNELEVMHITFLGLFIVQPNKNKTITKKGAHFPKGINPNHPQSNKIQQGEVKKMR